MMTEYVVTRWYRAPELLCENSVGVENRCDADLRLGSGHLVFGLHLRRITGKTASSAGQEPLRPAEAGHQIVGTPTRCGVGSVWL